MPTNVILPHGRQVDLDGVAVIRSVSSKESDGYNSRLAEDLAKRPDFNGVVPSRRWTVVLEKPNADGFVDTIYASDVSVPELVAAVPDLARRFQLIDRDRAAVAGKAHLIRPLDAREGSDNRAVIWIEGGSSNGLYVRSTAAEIRMELGQRAAHLTQIGEEGFVDRSRIERINAFQSEKPLEPGSKRFATSVQFKGVNAKRPQFFVATPAEITGAKVVDLRAGGPGRPADLRRRDGAASAPEVR
jgi:hypothetical protein